MSSYDRRSVLRAAAAITVAGLGGCVASPRSPEDSNATRSSATPTESPTTTQPVSETIGSHAPPSLEIDQTRMTSGEGSCGTEQRIAVRTTDDGVEIEGSILAPTPCHAASLERIAVSDRTIRAEIGVVDVGSLGCVACLGTIPFQLQLSTTVGAADAVVVKLDGAESLEETFRPG